MLNEYLTLAETVRTACLKAARDAYQDAAISGLCSEGAQEAALGAIEMVDIEKISAAIGVTAKPAEGFIE
jgi:hypothetical protein